MHSFTEGKFLRFVCSNHMEIVFDKGFVRHLRFSLSTGHFDLITWRGSLCITGDFGTFVFSRCEDMFKFFRSPVTSDELHINPSYWYEKCEAVDSNEGALEFNQEHFELLVKDYFDTYFEGSEKEKRACWQEIEQDVLRVDTRDEAYAALSDFNYMGFEFSNSWEWNIMHYTSGFIRCLYAIVWGIKKYDEAKKMQAPEVMSNHD